MTTLRSPRRRTIRKLNYLRLGIVIVIFFALVGIGAATGVIMYGMKDMPAWNPTALEPNMPSYIYDKDGKIITKMFVENRDPIEFNQIPDVVTSAFLSIEDTRFYSHNGLDLRRIIGALIADIRSGKKVQGASTITQQLVKRAFLSPEKTFKRKIQEAILAIQLERKYTKDDILEMYLNQIYFGEGAYGIESAAQVYFGKDANSLNLEEAALLAALPKAPNSYNPHKDMTAAIKRRNIVLSSMTEAGYITQEQAKAASAKPILLKGSKANIERYQFPYFVDYITELLVNKYGETKVYKGGLNVYTTLDPKIQTLAEAAMSNPKNFPKSKKDDKGVLQPQAAVVVIDPHTGFIKAIVGGRDHQQKRQFNRATDAVRQPGSTFKPVAVYGPALEKGKAPTDVVKDEPTKYGSWQVRNYDGKYRGFITYRTATMYSVNVAAVKVMNELGVNKCIEFAKRLGITSLVQKDENLSTALGGLTTGVKPLELAGAYGAFDNDGVYVQPTAITKIEDRDHNIIEEVRPKKVIAMKKTTAYLMTSMLESVVTSGTGSSASLGKRPVAGKTGTTSDDKDAWFAGYTPELVCVVWMGHDSPKPMSKVYGGSFPAKIWKYIMGNTLSNVPVKAFPKPPGIVSGTICSKSGKKPSDICPPDALVTDIFTRGTLPSKVCDVHVPVKVCSVSNLLPTDKCPNVVSKAFVKGQEPVQLCNIHNNTQKPIGTPICTDPIHGGILYLANIPGSNEQGGCPPNLIQYRVFPDNQAPTAPCAIPEHQARIKSPLNPSTPDSPQTGQVDKPTVPKPDDNRLGQLIQDALD